jgi:triosephosphate isomerase
MSTNTRIPFFGGNWKCNGSLKSIDELVYALNTAGVPPNVDVVVAPTNLHLSVVQSAIKAPIQVSAQNCSVTGNGAYTGEVSADMLVDHGVKYVILGHSERRQLYGETDALIGQKTKVALSKGLNVIACIGETLDERKADQTMAVCMRQLAAIGSNIASPSEWARVVVAYEPVWAIGTGVTATSQQAQEVHSKLRAWMASNYGYEIAAQTRIIYGGI